MLSKELTEFLLHSKQRESLLYLENILDLPTKDKAVETLDQLFLEKVFKHIKLSENFKLYLINSLQLFEDISVLKELLNISRRIIENYKNIDTNKWPSIAEENHVYAKAFEIQIFIFNIPVMLERYKKLGIPEKYATDLLEDFKIWVEDYFEKHQKFGLSELGWLSNHLNLKTFQIGRLQFEPRQNPLPYFCFRNQVTCQTLVMVSQGLEVRNDGLFNGSNGQFENETLRTDLQIDDEFISGFVVNPSGVITNKKITLSKKEWMQILCPTSTVLSLHIPAAGALKKELLDASLIDAKAFFQRFFPEIAFTCFMTTTWFMDPTIANYLPNSNIATFQKSVYLVPIPKANGQQFNERVFGSADIDLESYVPQTSLQKIGIEHLRRGGFWKMYGFILYKEDVPLIENFYRTQYQKYL